jgi:hypothetical protein
MKLPRVRTIILAPFVVFALFYVSLVAFLLLDNETVIPIAGEPVTHQTVAIFGASGTAGGTTPRIEAGVASGKVKLTLHLDYLDYSAIHGQIGAADAVYWAIGTSSVGVDEETYGKIHVDFPVQFVREWIGVSDKPDISFHYISSSDISADSRIMWAREKVRAENTLFEIAADSSLRVIAYRPDYIGPTKEEAHIGQNLLYWFFAPVSSAVKATQIGQAMFEVTARGSEFGNGDRLGTRSIIRYSDAYQRRQDAAARISLAGDWLFHE